MQTMQTRETEQVCLQEVKTPAEFLRVHWLQFEDINKPFIAIFKRSIDI